MCLLRLSVRPSVRPSVCLSVWNQNLTMMQTMHMIPNSTKTKKSGIPLYCNIKMMGPARYWCNILQEPSFSCYSIEVSNSSLFSYCFGIIRIVCIIVKFWFQTTKFWFQTDGRTDGRTDKRNKHILGLPS